MERNRRRPRGVDRRPIGGPWGLTAAAALAVSCAGPRPWPKELERALSECPEALIKSVRNDYADDELEPPDYAALETFAGRVPREKLEYQLRTFVNPDESLLGWFRLDADGIQPDLLLAPERRVALAPPLGRPVEAPAGTLQAPVEADRPFRAERQFEPRPAAKPGLPLAGLRVLIDPGHFGGRYADFEQRRFAWPEGARRAEEELVAMVRGNVGAGRVYNPAYRARALRDALAIDEFNAAAHLGALCLRAMSRTLGLPVSRKRRYADHVPIHAADGEPSGVAAWNGAVLRYATGPAMLLEGPYMNEVGELHRLLDALRSPTGHPGTRTEQYASGVAQGIEDWARRWMAQARNDFGPEGLGVPTPVSSGDRLEPPRPAETGDPN